MNLWNVPDRRPWHMRVRDRLDLGISLLWLLVAGWCAVAIFIDRLDTSDALRSFAALLVALFVFLWRIFSEMDSDYSA